MSDAPDIRTPLPGPIARSFLERALLSAFLAVQVVCVLPASADALQNSCRKPPPEARPRVYWFWLNGKSAVGPRAPRREKRGSSHGGFRSNWAAKSCRGPTLLTSIGWKPILSAGEPGFRPKSFC